MKSSRLIVGLCLMALCTVPSEHPQAASEFDGAAPGGGLPGSHSSTRGLGGRDVDREVAARSSKPVRSSASLAVRVESGRAPSLPSSSLHASETNLPSVPFTIGSRAQREGKLVPQFRNSAARPSSAVFIENRGQFNPQARFKLTGAGPSGWVADRGIVFDELRAKALPFGTSSRPPSAPSLSWDQFGAAPGMGLLPFGIGYPPGRGRRSASFPDPSDFQRVVFSENFVGPHLSPEIDGQKLQPGDYNYFVGNDPSQWVTHAHGYSEVVYHNLWAGIDLRLYGKDADVEQEFIIRPGGDPTSVQVAYNGIKGLEIAPDGSLIVHTAGGDLRETKPRIYQEIAGNRVPVAGQFKLISKNAYTFEVSSHQAQYALVIDPTLSYSTFLGGSAGYGLYGYGDENEWGIGIAVDSAGSAYVVGMTASTDFPTTTGSFEPMFSGSPGTGNISTGVEAFVTKLSPDGSQLVYSTYLGGPDQSWGLGVAVDSAGEAYVTGSTYGGFPTTANAFLQTGFGPFVTKLSAAGDALTYSTYLESQGDILAYDIGNSIAVDSSGIAYLTGTTTFAGFPTTANAVQTVYSGSRDCFVAVIDPSASGTASLLYSTYLGGTYDQFSEAIALDSSEKVYVTGDAGSGFPLTPGAFQNSCSARYCTFVAKLDPFAPSGPQSLVYSAYFGGSGESVGYGIAVDSSGAVFVSGEAESGSPVPFPTTAGAFETTPPTLPAESAAFFVTELSPDGSSLVYSTFLGAGSGGIVITLDAAGNAYIAGSTTSADFPITTDAYQSQFYGGNISGWDAFLTILNPTGSALVYSTFLGRENDDSARGIALDAAGNIYITGITLSADFPITPLAFQNLLHGSGGIIGDVFVAKFSPSAPTGFSITGLTATAGGNSGSVTDTIVGSGFQQSATAALVCGGEPAIAGSNVTVSADGTTLTATFNLVGTTPGTCDLVVTNPDGTSVTDSQAFTIEQGGAPQVRVDLIGLDKIRVGSAETFYISSANSGAVDASDQIVSVLVPVPLVAGSAGGLLLDEYQTGQGNVLSYDLPQVAAGSDSVTDLSISTPDDPTLTQDAFTVRGQLSSRAALSAAQNTSSLSTMTSQQDDGLLLGPGLFDSCSQPVDTCPACSAQWNSYQGYLDLAQTSRDAFLASQKTFLLQGLLVGADIARDVGIASGITAIVSGLGLGLVAEGILTTSEATNLGTYVGAIAQYSVDAMRAGPNNPAGVLTAAGNATASIVQADTIAAKVRNSLGIIKSGALQATADAFLYGLGVITTAINTLSQDSGTLKAAWDARNAGRDNFLNADTNMCAAANAYLQCALSQCGRNQTVPPPGNADDFDFPLQPVGSLDPNDKAGSRGAGAQQFVTGATPLRYSVYFTNETSATAPAQSVSITDQLDATHDNLGTFSLGPITFGSQLLTPPPLQTSYSTTADLRPETDLLVAVNASLNSSTGLLTWSFQSLDPTTNKPPTDPTVGFLPPGVGGSAFFTVMPKPGLATNTQIQNQASIVFDVNAPISTPAWSNMLDNTPPVSKVSALSPTEASATFPVSWSGTDVGAGIQDFTISISDNGAPSQPWLTNTSSTSATYRGKLGHTYAFYSQARDLTGNQEGPHSKADTSTAIVGVQDFSIGSSALTESVIPGGTVSYDLVIRPGLGFKQAVNVACSAPQQTITCSLTPNSVTPDGLDGVATKLTVMTVAPSSIIGTSDRELLLPRPLLLPTSVPVRVLLALLAFALAGFAARGRATIRGWAFRGLVLLLLAVLVGACGSSSTVSIHTPTGGTPAGNYTLTVTATSTTASGEALNHSTTVQLVVN